MQGRIANLSQRSVEQELLIQGRAFDLGFIPCQRLVDILVPPFLKLGHKANDLQVGGVQSVLDGIANTWGRSAIQVISGKFCHREDGIEVQSALVLRPQKRADLVRALLRSGKVEVSQFTT